MIDTSIETEVSGISNETPADTNEKNRKISNTALMRLIDIKGPKQGAPPGPHITQLLAMNS